MTSRPSSHVPSEEAKWWPRKPSGWGRAGLRRGRRGPASLRRPGPSSPSAARGPQLRKLPAWRLRPGEPGFQNATGELGEAPGSRGGDGAHPQSLLLRLPTHSPRRAGERLAAAGRPSCPDSCPPRLLLSRARRPLPGMATAQPMRTGAKRKPGPGARGNQSH